MDADIQAFLDTMDQDILVECVNEEVADGSVLGLIRQILTPGVLAPGAATGGPDDPPIHEPGSRETAVVTAGRVTLVCDGIAHDLEDGDAVTFDADLPHHFENPGDREASFTAVVSAGLRRS